MKKNEVATIKPSEHLELILFRMEEMVFEMEGDIHFYKNKIENEARRLKAWLEENGN